jgi:hypothetical protein
MLSFTSVGHYYAKPHYLIGSSSLLCSLNCTLYRSKKKVAHEKCEDNRNCLVLPFRPKRGVGQKVTVYSGRAHDRGLLPMANRKQAMTMEAKRY